ncbi:indole-3-glycerol phosphate synthase TrpC [Bacillus sp. PS06]|uniref:indole-3-glycerol phosphate synthase TrpC n=1 Tax=Bacillus sp. PS06 TaxID=2764176 RepID=UPI0017868A66|nr:indole-3-glycerol phosphate synthase TrpC [Bacillus sp. PS06]MBD8070246.1 indole-3-glycerol phosphate synthase TrpC [Bacillus sp. PS06]
MLTKIIEQKKHEIQKLTMPEFKDVQRRSLYKALYLSNRKPALIAEIKKASPSKGLIREKFNHLEIACSYQKAKVDAMSVLTDEVFFQGSIQYLAEVKDHVDVPILRKDFIIDSKQIEQSVRIGADAILLIGEVLDPSELHEFYLEAYEKGVECLVEVHSRETLERILAIFSPKILGVNNRNLKTFETNLIQTKELVEYIPKESLLVSESGIHTSEDLKRVAQYGANAVLIGEAFMRCEIPGKGIAQIYEEDYEFSTH